jgi:hypothetical protein
MRNYEWVRALYRKIEEFNSWDGVADWDYGRFSRFMQWLLVQKGLRESSVVNYARALRLVTKRQEFKFSRIRRNVLYVNNYELMILETADNLPAYMDDTRNLFLISCYTGIRISDLSKIQRGNPIDVLLDILNKAGRGKSHPSLSQHTYQLIEKINGRLPAMDEIKADIYIKALFRYSNLQRPVTLFKGKKTEVHPLYEVAGMHIARNTFIMTMLLDGTSVCDLASLAGMTDFNVLRPYLEEVHKTHILEQAHIAETIDSFFDLPPDE